ncbi:MAG: uracil-DNA glycosylase [Candidatus Moranbacteria bacterium RIFCSPHIGHO2_01_FULL_55_24]|nr:MAG: uracil-DNA glycosylase [Candidatus Moranbacteria bacterium RIFCSPHIGHO2_01_FULL_55_24]
MDTRALLQELNERHDRLSPCKLKESATHAVPGDGNPDADIMFVGEAPGKNEDLEGKPFVGAAGKFLNEMLAGIGLKREDIYITNVVKYRPPNNRDPLPEEVEACMPWLHDQIMLIKPKLIVTLGRHAMEHFVPGKKISQIHGTAFRRSFDDMGTQVFYALYHPAAALYNGGMRETLMKDFQKIPAVLETLEKERGGPSEKAV